MLRLVYDSDNMDCDLAVTEDGTDVSRSLETAVLISLFSDARAEPADDLLEGTERRGWWAEAYFDGDEHGDVWGSKLWQLETRKATAESLVFAQTAAERSLEWLIEDGICQAVSVETWWLEGRQGYMGLLVTLKRPDKVSPEYIGPWELHYAVV